MGKSVRVTIDIPEKYADALSLTCIGLGGTAGAAEVWLATRSVDLSNGTHIEITEDGRAVQSDGGI